MGLRQPWRRRGKRKPCELEEVGFDLGLGWWDREGQQGPCRQREGQDLRHSMRMDLRDAGGSEKSI